MMRSTGVWTYGVVNLVHILGIALLFGAIMVLDLRLLGVWRRVPLALISGPLVTVAAIGFAMAAITGIPMLATKAVDYAGNPFLFLKLPAIALALFNVWLVHRTKAWRAHKSRELEPQERRRLAGGAALSLLLWLTAITCGRMIAYW